MKRLTIILLILLAVNLLMVSDSSAVQQVDAESSLKKANELYINKNYDSAISEYEKLVSEGFESVELFYNLGNAYYRSGRYGYAVLNYERALKLSPADEDVIHNIALVNSQLVDKVDTLPKFFLFQWWESLLAVFSLSGWTTIAYILLILVLLAAIGYFFSITLVQQKISVVSGIVSIILLLLSVSILIVRLNREVNLKAGVVVEQAVTVKLAPDEKSNDGFIIHEGLKVKVEDRIDDWLKIRLEDGKIGWIPGDKVRVI
ncbi:MAG: tetratricopeptide repeat protein [Ignavibacteriales bacterium]|nr:MAG: tetratricopeptide repeat protein [Ignavibacteriales bacterium]